MTSISGTSRLSSISILYHCLYSANFACTHGPMIVQLENRPKFQAKNMGTAYTVRGAVGRSLYHPSFPSYILDAESDIDKHMSSSSIFPQSLAEGRSCCINLTQSIDCHSLSSLSKRNILCPIVLSISSSIGQVVTYRTRF